MKQIEKSDLDQRPPLRLFGSGVHSGTKNIGPYTFPKLGFRRSSPCPKSRSPATAEYNQPNLTHFILPPYANGTNHTPLQRHGSAYCGRLFPLIFSRAAFFLLHVYFTFLVFSYVLSVFSGFLGFNFSFSVFLFLVSYILIFQNSQINKIPDFLSHGFFFKFK